MEFGGSNYFRFRLALSMISGKAITIKNIRSKKIRKKYMVVGDDEELIVGLQEYEAKLLKLIDKLCDDTIIKINEDGDELYFKPGFLIGNVIDEVRISDLNNSFHCGKERSITYFLEFLLMIVPFFKNPVKLLLKGITDDCIDSTVYTCKIVSEHFFKTFLKVDNNFLNINILKRGIKSDCSGEVLFFMNNLKTINSFDMHDSGLVRKITGTVVSKNISLVFRNKFINFAKRHLQIFTPYVSIEIEKVKGKDDYLKNNFISLSLFAHTKNKCIYGSDLCIDEPFLQHVKNALKRVKPSDRIRMQEIPYNNMDITKIVECVANHGRKEHEEVEEKGQFENEKNIDDCTEVENENSSHLESRDNEIQTQCKDEKNMVLSNDNISCFMGQEWYIKNDNVIGKMTCNLRDAEIYERLGFFISLKMMNEIKGLSSVDTNYQWLPLLYMSLAEDTTVSKISLNVVKPYSIALIRLLRDFFNVVFDIKKVEKSQINYSYIIKCVGIGYRNFSKKTF
ncbi:RNA 3'-terminal phosphate cyclase-like protein, putative [Plasmodium malariae]|uniref:RNA 3'-terminal phosphate cyclase-like protein, putative n=1 Tax=Plasmodium malariae TaxID=5858 RepID=A0A1C3L127_PLAMA|nr:RNA 3'-terminal phosphate cyclase-like protein, putative [Plasmodium malariae]